jgi:diguanylate cyclase (GGDEF)-like protein
MTDTPASPALRPTRLDLRHHADVHFDFGRFPDGAGDLAGRRFPKHHFHSNLPWHHDCSTSGMTTALAAPPLVTTKAKGRVLVVDDSGTIRLLLTASLRQAGFEVVLAADGAAALARLDDSQPEVVLTDLQMPGMDGFALLERIRARPGAPEVIVVTGTHARDMDAALRALRLGAHDFLTKPLPAGDAVALTIEKALEKKRLREANERLLRELEALSRTDALSGALNRRVFDETLRRELARAERHAFAVSLLLFDLDHFKRINDTHGHPAGDEVLRVFGHALAEEVRESDAVFRYGGEEFAVLLTHTPLAGAVKVAERLVARTRALAVPVSGATLRFTASVGVATSDGGSLDPAGLIEAADRALYEAKHLGRDQVAAQVAQEKTR